MPLSCLPISKWKATWKDGCCCGFLQTGPKTPKSERKALLDEGNEADADAALSNIQQAARGNDANILEVDGDFLAHFEMLPEPTTIEVQEGNFAPFSLPQECLSYVPKPEEVVLSFQNGESERMISCNIELSKDELSMLQKCREEAARQGLAFLPSVTVAAVRYLNDVGDLQGALQKMQENQAWRLKYFQKPLHDFEMPLSCQNLRILISNKFMPNYFGRFVKSFCMSHLQAPTAHVRLHECFVEGHFLNLLNPSGPSLLQPC